MIIEQQCLSNKWASLATFVPTGYSVLFLTYPDHVDVSIKKECTRLTINTMADKQDVRIKTPSVYLDVYKPGAFAVSEVDITWWSSQMNGKHDKEDR